MKIPSQTEQHSAITQPLLPAPNYLKIHYWWAYIHPRAVYAFERQWLVNLILWGNYNRLCEAVLDGYEHKLFGSTLQIACAYGDLTPRLAACMQPGSLLEVIDILQIQLDNLSKKLSAIKLSQDSSIKLRQMDSSAITLENESFDRTLIFFLLHEQPEAVRRKTLSEALRVTRQGGTLTIVDYAPLHRTNPLRYLWCPLLKYIEPYASDLFQNPLSTWLPKDDSYKVIHHQRVFGGMYQVMTLTRES